MPAQIHYFTLEDETPRKEKLDWFRNNKLSDLAMERIHPDEKGNWLNITDNDFEDLLPLASKDVKGNKAGLEFDKAVFKLFSLGVVTARDEWVYDFDKTVLEKKVTYLIDIYNFDVERLKGKNKDEIRDGVDTSIKWTRGVKNDLSMGRKYEFYKVSIIESIYRPFVKKKLYFNKELNEMQYQMNVVFPKKKENTVIAFSGEGSSKPFQLLAQNGTYSHDMLEKTQCLPLYRYDKSGNQIENITEWGLEQFKNHYPLKITKEAIFHYVYAVLHNPAYRKKYEQNLKRDFPRIPFYEDFEQWASWGKALMDLHIDYENADLFPLNRVERAITQGASSDQRQLFARVEEVEPLYKTEVKVKIKPKLKADKETGIIEIDEQTTLTGVPTEAWAYKLYIPMNEHQ